MKQLPFPDQHFVNSALGWLELGNHAEARVEAERISADGRTHQDAFLIRWRIAGRVANWTEAHRLASAYIQVCPTQATGWICLSYSLYRLQRPLEAWMELLPKLHDFPTLSAIPYILACYASELGNPLLAQRFLARSKRLGGPAKVRGSSLETEDLDAITGNPPSIPKNAAAPDTTSNRPNPGRLGRTP